VNKTTSLTAQNLQVYFFRSLAVSDQSLHLGM